MANTRDEVVAGMLGAIVYIVLVVVVMKLLGKC